MKNFYFQWLELTHMTLGQVYDTLSSKNVQWSSIWKNGPDMNFAHFLPVSLPKWKTDGQCDSFIPPEKLCLWGYKMMFIKSDKTLNTLLMSFQILNDFRHNFSLYTMLSKVFPHVCKNDMPEFKTRFCKRETHVSMNQKKS